MRLFGGRRRSRRGRAALVILLLVAVLTPSSGATADEEFEQLWSATLMAQFKFISDRQANNGVTDFFDQWQWTPNKSSALPTELAIRDLDWLWMGQGDTPRMQLRFASPTSNLGVSGSEIDQPFLNQRAELLGRFDGVAFDVRYWRFRTENLRLFPNTLGRAYTDLTVPWGRFNRDRTGFFAEARVRPMDGFPDVAGKSGLLLRPQLSLRGGYESRNGSQQQLTMLPGTNAWLGFSKPQDQEVAKAGGGLLMVPLGIFTLNMDVDYKRFRNEPTILQGQVASGVPPANQTLGFIPDTDQLSGLIQLQGQIGDRAVLEGGFQVTSLEQVADYTPNQIAAGLVNNKLLYYSANLAARVELVDRLSANAFVKYDQRNNDIDRTTALFNPVGGSQVDAFLNRWNRIYAGGEIVYEPRRRSLVALGARFEWIDRDLSNAVPVPGNQVILPANALVGNETKMWTVYGRTRLRPARGLTFTAELGYRGAPATGYITDLDKYVYGKFRASYVLRLPRPVILSAFAQGGTGENDDFTMVSGQGPLPPGPLTPRRFNRSDYLWGVTITSSPIKDVTLFASFVCARDNQDYGIVLSSLQRYFQTGLPITFRLDGEPEFSNAQKSLILGMHTRLLEKTDAGISYAFTRSDATYGAQFPSAAIAATSLTSVVDSNIHSLQFEVGHWLRDGLRVLAGYRLQLLDDDSPLQVGPGGRVPALPLSMTQHTLTFGVTLNSDLFGKKDG